MRGRSRLLRVEKWTGLVACVVLMMAWGLSLRWHIGYVAQSHLYAWTLDGGTFRTTHVTPPAAVGSDGEFGFSAGNASAHKFGFILPSIRTMRGRGVPCTRTRIPVWSLLAISAPLTGLLFWRDRRYPRGHCQDCGYNLTGNTSGVCPECAAELEA